MTAGGRADDRVVVAELRVALVVRKRDGRFEAEVEDYPLVRETGRTAWEAINRMVGAHRALLERRWSA